MGNDWCHQDGDAVLLVEGSNDCHVILALCQLHNVPQTFGLYECGSDDRAIRRMNALLQKENPPKIIGLVIDADRPDLAGRWTSIRSKLSNHPYVLPTVPLPDGTILEANDAGSRLGFWLMPNNQVDGMLEDFCRDMIDVSAVGTVEQCLHIAEASGHTSFKSVHRSKAFVHTYLAWQDEPGKPLGQAITAQALQGNTDTAQRFVKWLTDLFRV